MDTISRENNSSMLPLGGVIVGVIGLLLGGFALVQSSKANKAIADNQPKLDKIDAIEASASSAATNAANVAKDLKTLKDSTQDAFNTLVPTLQGLQTSVTRLEELAKKPAPVAAKGGKAGPVEAGPGEYVVKAGDSFSVIARSQGTTPAAIAQVNPGVESSKLKPGQKIKLPKK